MASLGRSVIPPAPNHTDQPLHHHDDDDDAESRKVIQCPSPAVRKCAGAATATSRIRRGSGGCEGARARGHWSPRLQWWVSHRSHKNARIHTRSPARPPACLRGEELPPVPTHCLFGRPGLAAAVADDAAATVVGRLHIGGVLLPGNTREMTTNRHL